MQQLNCIGESRHQAKHEYKQYCQDNGVAYNPTKTIGIHSYNTYETYKQTSKEFASWIKRTHPEVRNIDRVTKNMCVEYLKSRQETCSAYTVSKDMAALNKLFRTDINKSEAGLTQRSYKNITRSRNDCTHDKSVNLDKYSDQITVAKAFGIRRESFVDGQFALKDVSIYQEKGQVYCSVVEKGGRYRNAPCLDEYKEIVKEKFNICERETLTVDKFKELYSESNNKLFSEYSNKIDNHAYRAEYATNLYKQLANPASSDLYRGYDKPAIQEVSKALGHNRLSVVVEHYLRT